MQYKNYYLELFALPLRYMIIAYSDELEACKTLLHKKYYLMCTSTLDNN